MPTTASCTSWIVDDLRSSYHAHADRTPRRTLLDTAAYLGVEGPPTYAEGWFFLSDAELMSIATLAEKQQVRFETEAVRLGAKLGEERQQSGR